MATTFLAAMSRNVLTIEAAIGAVIIVLLIAILVMNRRKKKAAVMKPPAGVPNYYADLQQQPGGRPDPFGSFASATVPAAVTTVPAAVTTSTSQVSTTPATPSVTTSPPPPAPVEPAAIAPVEVATNGADLSGAFRVAPQPSAGPAWPSTESWSPGFAPQGAGTLVEASALAATATIAQGTSSPSAAAPAGWLPDPGGAPDTLRYWDGNAWTEHFAQRS